LLGIGVIAALVIGWQVAAFAVHDTGAFELEGNAVNDPPPGDDWDNVCHQVTITNDTSNSIPNECASAANTTGATAVSWTGEANANSSIFTGGGSKDPEDVSSWAWKDAGGLPDKDNLQHGFAARYSLPSTGVNTGTCPIAAGSPAGTRCELLYFGSDRFDNSGDAQQGFWFFQNPVSLTNEKSGGGFKFSGVHRDGDLLVISDFSNGGDVSTITVYKWNSSLSDHLQLLATSDDANCATAQETGEGTPPATVSDSFCGIVNPANGTTAPWSFTDKSGNHSYLQGELYEGGVNLSALGLAGECFSSALSETRSSTSTTATLKDFTLGSFATCKPGMTTQASTNGTVAPKVEVRDTATIKVTGATNPADPTSPPDVTFFLCNVGTATTGCTTGGTNVGTGTLVGGAVTNDGTATATSPDVNTDAAPLASGRYCFRAEWDGNTTYPGKITHTNNDTECFTVQDTSAISTTQSWVPNDTATVTSGSGGTAPAGTVTFAAFASADCTGDAFAGLTGLTNRTVTNGTASTANTTAVTADTATKTISWRATFTPTGTGTTGSTSHCETSTVTINNDIGS